MFSDIKLEAWTQPRWVQGHVAYLHLFTSRFDWRMRFRFLSQNQQSKPGTSLVVQWLRIRLPTQETWARSLVRELRSQFCGATKPARRNYWAPMLWSPRATTRERSTLRKERSCMLQWRSHMLRLRPDAAKWIIKQKKQKPVQATVRSMLQDHLHNLWVPCSKLLRVFG